MIYVDGLATTEQNEALLSEFTAHDALVRAELHTPRLRPGGANGAHFGHDGGDRSVPVGRRSATSPTLMAGTRLIEFATGAAAEVRAAGH